MNAAACARERVIAFYGERDLVIGCYCPGPVLATRKGRDNRCRCDEDEFRDVPGAFESEVDTILRALFDTVRSHRTDTSPIGMLLGDKHMAEIENSLETDGCNAVF